MHSGALQSEKYYSLQKKSERGKLDKKWNEAEHQLKREIAYVKNIKTKRKFNQNIKHVERRRIGMYKKGKEITVHRTRTEMERYIKDKLCIRRKTSDWNVQIAMGRIEFIVYGSRV